MASLRHCYYSIFQLVFLVDYVYSVPVFGRPGIVRAINQRDEQHMSGLFSREIPPAAIPGWVVAVVIFSLLVIWALYPCTLRQLVRKIRDYIRGRGSPGSANGRFNTLESTAPEVETNFNPRQGRRPVLLPAPVAQTPSVFQLEREQISHKTPSRSSSVPAPAIPVTPSNPNFSSQMRAAGNITITPLRRNSWLPNLNVSQPPKMPAESGSGSGLLARGASSSSSSPSSPSHTPTDTSSQSQIDLQTAPEMITSRASSPRPNPASTALMPNPRSSIDVASVNDSPSLAEFPVPPTLNSPTNTLSPLPYSPGDLGTPRSAQSPASPSGANAFNTIDEDLAFTPPIREGSPEYGPPSAASTRPPTYYGSWHRSTPSQTSFATLPAYPGIEGDGDGDGDNRLSRVSRAPTYRSSIASLRTPRNPRPRPPLPIPPLPSDLPK